MQNNTLFRTAYLVNSHRVLQILEPLQEIGFRTCSMRWCELDNILPVFLNLKHKVRLLKHKDKLLSNQKRQHSMNIKLMLPTRDWTTKSPSFDCCPIHNVPDLFGSSCRWWVHRRMDPFSTIWADSRVSRGIVLICSSPFRRGH